jgi:hypothetical protein
MVYSSPLWGILNNNAVINLPFLKDRVGDKAERDLQG